MTACSTRLRVSSSTKLLREVVGQYELRSVRVGRAQNESVVSRPLGCGDPDHVMTSSSADVAYVFGDLDEQIAQPSNLACVGYDVCHRGNASRLMHCLHKLVVGLSDATSGLAEVVAMQTFNIHEQDRRSLSILPSALTVFKIPAESAGTRL